MGSPTQPIPGMKDSMSSTYAEDTRQRSSSAKNSKRQIPNDDLKKLRKCQDRTTRTLIIAAVHAGFRYRMTKGGVMIYGNEGVVSVHFTESDHRAVRNTQARFKQLGFEI